MEKHRQGPAPDIDIRAVSCLLCGDTPLRRRFLTGYDVPNQWLTRFSLFLLQGAAAVLEFYSIESPLAQPRNSVFGQVLSAVVGVAIGKLLQLSPHFESIRWLGGAISCALATTVMALTKTVHPPAGATALLAVVDDGVLRLGWILVPIVALGSVVMLVVALIMNNFQRCFPQYWWSPEDLRLCRVPWRRRGDNLESRDDIACGRIEAQSSRSVSTAKEDAVLIIRPGEVIVPKHLFITPEDKMFLEALSNRL
ncbi:hypothetical protein LZ32DRAFT_600988 [Colletotrichum eremochloae]|nr:hypothetical protein LZ32DRAFT_600988 [Colletotrichum eremochloae]